MDGRDRKLLTFQVTAIQWQHRTEYEQIIVGNRAIIRIVIGEYVNLFP